MKATLPLNLDSALYPAKDMSPHIALTLDLALDDALSMARNPPRKREIGHDFL